jgi:ribonuclease P protein subunit RPR2
MKPNWVKKAASQSIDTLLRLAKQGGPKAKRYVELARLHSRKYKVGLGARSGLVCKECGSLLVPGRNLRVRMAQKPGKTVVYTCLDCGNRVRRPTGARLKKRVPQKR